MPALGVQFFGGSEDRDTGSVAAVEWGVQGLYTGPGHLEPEKAAWSCLPRALMGSETKAGAGPGNACGPGIRIGLFYL